MGSKYYICKKCGLEFHGSDREKHVKEVHGEEMNVAKPSEWFKAKKAKAEAKENPSKNSKKDKPEGTEEVVVTNQLNGQKKKIVVKDGRNVIVPVK